MGARELGAFGGALPEASGAYGFNPPELRAYQPSWRDRLALALQNVLPEQTVEGLMGSRGLGPTQRNAGMGLVDFTPAGIPLAVNEAQRSGEEGDWLGATVNAMAMVPGAKAGTKAIEAGVNEVKQGIRAYHGSPHDFDKFDLSKIGTGEGAQAYGHGLYFAENEGVAKQYRETLSQFDTVLRGGKPLPIDDTDAGLAAAYVQSFSGVDEAKARLKAELASGYNDPIDEEWKKAALSYLDQHGSDISLAKNPGRTYEVSINAHPDEFLDWDKPLSEQPKAVQDAFASVQMGKLHDGMRVAGGGTLRIENDPDMGPRYFLEMGTSRFRMSPADLRNLIGSGAEGKSAYQAMTEAVGNEAAASEALRAAGIKGIRYKDAGSRGADKAGGTSNYVVFSDDLITILRKYGLAGLTVGGAGGAGFYGLGDQPAQAAPQPRAP